MLNLFEIPALDTFAPTALRKDLGLIAREPFARGRLLPPKPSAAGQLGFLGQQYDARFENCATALARTVPQMAIQFLAQSAGVSVVLAGMSSAEHVRANVRALELPSLSQQDMLTIRAIATDERIRPTSD